MILNTDSGKTPTMRPPAGKHWACHRVRPATGRPQRADGTLILVWEWQLEGKAPVAAPEPPREALSPRQRRIVAAQSDLFGQ